jgi:hypothetical protein
MCNKVCSVRRCLLASEFVDTVAKPVSNDFWYEGDK